MSAQLQISEETMARVHAFKQVIEAVLEEQLPTEAYGELLLEEAMRSMLADLLRPLDPEVLLQSFTQLAAAHPREVYAFVAETLRRGGAAEGQQVVKRRLGFSSPADARATGKATDIRVSPMEP